MGVEADKISTPRVPGLVPVYAGSFLLIFLLVAKMCEK